jgi:hypothetical protein
MTNDKTPDNVLQFPKKPTVLFNEKQKSSLVRSINDLSDMPELVVERIESDLCVQVIAGVREFADNTAKTIADKLAKLIFG